MNPNKYIPLKLGLVQEVYTMFIVFPFCIYFLATACSFEEGQLLLLAWAAGGGAFHAGEHGVGFGVIATSVRALSIKSGEVIKQLSIEVNQTLAQSKNSLEVLRDMLPEVENVTQIMGEISSASQEEDTAIQYIADSVNTIADSSKGTSEDSEALLITAEKMNEDSQNLKEQLKFFKFE
ncbi:methyl-accepting chemotaxis protein [Fibrobacterales bacterium]|nr:methyl-accepting chemotaxis protein [Fibrobacterales bacterium]